MSTLSLNKVKTVNKKCKEENKKLEMSKVSWKGFWEGAGHSQFPIISSPKSNHYYTWKKVSEDEHRIPG